MGCSECAQFAWGRAWRRHDAASSRIEDRSQECADPAQLIDFGRHVADICAVARANQDLSGLQATASEIDLRDSDPIHVALKAPGALVPEPGCLLREFMLKRIGRRRVLPESRARGGKPGRWVGEAGEGAGGQDGSEAARPAEEGRSPLGILVFAAAPHLAALLAIGYLRLAGLFSALGPRLLAGSVIGLMTAVALYCLVFVIAPAYGAGALG